MLLALTTFAHLLVLVYWLGGDLGVFYLSRTVTNSHADNAQRQFAVRMLLALDLAPRISMIATLPTGLTLAAASGWLVVPPWLVAACWIGAGVWLGLMLFAHRHPAAELARRVDLVVRYALLIGITAFSWSLTLPLFIAVKLQLFTVTIALGLWVRRCLKPLPEGLAALANGDLDTANRLISASIGASRKPVLGIWAVVGIAAVMGLWRPL